MSALSEFVERWKDCQECPLAQQRFRICLGRGDLPCDVLFVGEAPGAVEDVSGLVFTGPAGQLLDRIVERALPPEVTSAYTNLVCCFPREAKGRGDNEPEYDEILACKGRLIEFVNLAQPRLTVCVGALAEQYMPVRLNMKYHCIPHPAHMLRMPLAQKQMAVQRAVVTLRTAVADAMKGTHKFTPWRNEHGTHFERTEVPTDSTDPNEPPW